jgi:hypothetical protein
VFVPDLVAAFTTAPVWRPNSALNELGQDLELAYRLDPENIAGGAPSLVELVVQHRPVKREEVARVTRPVNTQLHAEAGAVAPSTGIGELYAGRERRQLDVAASVQREPLICSSAMRPPVDPVVVSTVGASPTTSMRFSVVPIASVKSTTASRPTVSRMPLR